MHCFLLASGVWLLVFFYCFHALLAVGILCGPQLRAIADRIEHWRAVRDYQNLDLEIAITEEQI